MRRLGGNCMLMVVAIAVIALSAGCEGQFFGPFGFGLPLPLPFFPPFGLGIGGLGFGRFGFGGLGLIGKKRK